MPGIGADKDYPRAPHETTRKEIASSFLLFRVVRVDSSFSSHHLALSPALILYLSQDFFEEPREEKAAGDYQQLLFLSVNQNNRPQPPSRAKF